MEYKDIIGGIANFYNDQVKEADANGYADKLKNCSELFFADVKKETSVSFTDTAYLDGYFIFGYGTNSVVHFHIDECPGWKFGIWWTLPKNEERFFDGTFFAQYESNIDKFKPSASVIKCDITAVPDDYCSCYHASEIISFIKNEPYLAFCREYLYWDYNTEYHTREEAKQKYDKYIDSMNNKIKYTEQFDEEILSFVKQNVIPRIKCAEIYDLGDGWSPRYEIKAPYEKRERKINCPGWHDWFDSNDESGKEIVRQFDLLVDKCSEVASEFDFCWFSPIGRTVYYYEEDK